MKNLSIALLSAATLLTCSVACNTSKKAAQTEPVPVKTTTQNYDAIHQILHGEWIAYKVGNQMVEGSDRPYVIFNSEKGQGNGNFVKFYANDGCNIVNGAFDITTTGKMVKAGELISTLRFCPDATYEMGMTLALNDVAKYELDKMGDDYLLNMKGANDSTLMVLRKYDLNFINGAWGVTHINGQAVPDGSELTLIIDTPEQKIHGSVGCNTMNGRINLSPDSQNAISFSNMITTRMTCPDIKTEQSLLEALSKVASVTPIDDLAGAQFKDANGHILITVKRLQLR